MHMGQLFDEKMKTHLGRVQVHIHQNLDLYVAGAAGLVAGVYLTKKLQRPVDVEQVIQGWVNGLGGRGIRVWEMGSTQHDLWKANIEYIAAYSQSTGRSVYDIARDMARELRIDADHFPKK